MRFVLAHKHGPADAPEWARLERACGEQILDRVGNQVALIDTSQDIADQLRVAFPDWLIRPESITELPTSRGI